MSRTVRSWTWLSCVALIGTLGTVAPSSAQMTVATTPGGEVVQLKGPGPDSVGLNGAVATFKMAVGAGGDMERIVKNAPFSAQAVTTTTQVLGDGNRIQQTSEMTLARDSEGRTRREMSVEKLGPWSTDTNGRIVFIRDPVSLAIYEIAPDGQHATKRTLFVPVPDQLDPKHQAEMRAHTKMMAERAHAEGAGEHGAVMHTEAHGAAFGGQPFEFQTMIIGGEAMGAAKKEALGEQTIEGVRAQGTRETRTIPAGKIGNERPIEIVSETWFSPDLQMVVQSRHSDPRVGETIYKLTNIAVGEPDASQFQVPAGVTVQEEKDVLRMIRTKKLDEQLHDRQP
jgi:hypothetical protein